jgi:ubiquinone/menaquinone biosynthesis C-methylase UbiE
MNHAIAEKPYKPYKGRGMEGATARWYASLTRKSLDQFQTMARRVAAEISEGARVLEVAPGPGYFAIELAKLGRYAIVGLDISRTLVDIAARNAAQAGVAVDFRIGDAAHMPFEDRSFDFLFCSAAFKNFTRPLEALREMYRVLKPGGRALVIDLRGDASMESIRRAVKEMHVGGLNALITRLTFRFMLLKRAYTRQQFERFLSETDFGPIHIKEDLIACELSLERSLPPRLH